MRPMDRRQFLVAPAAAAASQTQVKKIGTKQEGPGMVRFGIDLFSIRSQKMDAFQYLDYCAQWKAKVVHFSEIRFLGGLEPEHLKKVRAHAEERGIEVEIGMRSVCPTSKAFDAAAGSAEEQLMRMIESARLVGSPIVRAFLGTSADRTGPIPIEGHIENTIRVLRNVRSRVMDAGLKVAIENHAGDLQGRELKSLIEGAGKDFVGACIDSGNPVWTLEDPHVTLETLAPYCLTSHIRDSYVFRSAEGLSVRWTRMGEGNVGIEDYVRKYQELCPGRALSLEIIVTDWRVFPIQDPHFWEGYRNVRAGEFMRFLRLAESGRAQPKMAAVPRELAAQREREDLEASARWMHQHLQL